MGSRFFYVPGNLWITLRTVFVVPLQSVALCWTYGMWKTSKVLWKCAQLCAAAAAGCHAHRLSSFLCDCSRMEHSDTQTNSHHIEVNNMMESERQWGITAACLQREKDTVRMSVTAADNFEVMSCWYYLLVLLLCFLLEKYKKFSSEM